MQNKIFLHTIAENKDNPQILVLIRELAFDLGKKKFKDIKCQKELNQELLHTFSDMCQILKSENLLNPKSISNLIDGLIDASTESKEQFLYRLIYEKEQVEKQILNQKNDIKDSIKSSLEAVEDYIQDSDFENKNEIIDKINDAMFLDFQMLEILKETTETAFLTTIEKGEDVRDTSTEIAKNIVYGAINEGNFTKQRFLEISGSVIETATVIANEDHLFAKDLIYGAIVGSKDGITKSIEKFKDDMKFAPDSQNLVNSVKDLIGIEEDFIQMLKDLMAQTQEPSASIINDILEDSLDSYYAKFKRVQNELSEQLNIRLEELKTNENINKFVKTATMKFEELKRELDEKSEKLKENFDANKKLESLKKEIDEFEKKAGEKMENLSSDLGENLKSKSKELGEKFYKAAENFIKNTKEKIGIKDDDKNGLN
ncbi:hypothetical protein [Campylobacter sp. RM16192]|uniref:hypothetical protein n=1 Tax=Campylobacter sp. RM16192 TaxID=1660080 RepID=UPI00145190F3|nr:hypothetical protein [Campylobacter sp. RM16192]QCD53486.1 hypothetical protein CDOMC_1912 [Campylobacter sp. RM16192]